MHFFFSVQISTFNVEQDKQRKETIEHCSGLRPFVLDVCIRSHWPAAGFELTGRRCWPVVQKQQWYSIET